MRSLINNQRSEGGSALVEMIFGISALFVPVAIALVSFTTVHRHASVAESVARETARAFVLASSEDEAWKRGMSAARLAYSDANTTFVRPTIECSHQPCLSPGGQVTVRVRFSVAVPWGDWGIAASHRQVVDPWRAFL
jgi:Flp pilus assembly protein TadG